MKVLMVRSKVKDESVAEVEAAIRELFSAQLSVVGSCGLF
jgi:hypothetical protein